MKTQRRIRRTAIISLLFPIVLWAAGCGSHQNLTPPMPLGADRAEPESLSSAPINVSWTSIGPRYPAGANTPGAAGKLQSFALDAGDPATMYVAGGYGRGWEPGTDSGIYRTTNGGASWTAANDGLLDTVVNDLWIGRVTHTLLLAATEYGGIFRSTDAGAHWTGVDPAPGAKQFAADGAKIWAVDSRGVERSDDHGITWKTAFAVSGANAIAAFDHHVYAGDIHGHFYARTVDGWKTRSALPSGVHTIVIDTATPTTIYATTWDSVDGRWASQRLYGSKDGGTTWSILPTPAGWYGAQMVAMSATTPHLLYAGAEFSMYATADFGKTWNKLNGFGDERGLYVRRRNGHDVCYITSDQGLFESDDCGMSASARNATQGLSNNVLSGMAAAGTSIVAMIADFGPAVSRDNGRTWHSPRGGRFYENGSAQINPYSRHDCYAVDFENVLNVSHDGCASFVPGARLSPGPVSWIAFDPRDSRHFYATGGGRLMQSTNGGMSLTRIPARIHDPAGVYVDPNAPSNVFVTCTPPNGVWPLLVSRDGGKTWTAVKGAVDFVTLAFPKSVPGTIVAADFWGDIYRSTDGGYSFSRVNPSPALVRFRTALGGKRLSPWRSRGAFDDPDRVRFPHADADAIDYGNEVPMQLAFNTKGKRPYLAMATTYGLYVSADFGTDWQRVDSSLSSHDFSSIQWLGGRIYASTAGQGIVVSDVLQ